MKPVRAGVAALATFAVGGLSGAAADRYSPNLFDWIDQLRGRDLLTVVEKQWPQPDCSVAAIGSDRLDLDPLRREKNDSAITTSDYLRSGDADPYQRATMEITLAGATDDTILIHSITPVIYGTDREQPSWALIDASDDCGGVTTRILDVRLANNEGFVIDRGLEDSSSGYPPNGLGDVFTVSESDPVALRLQFEACDMNYDFGLKIEYMLNSTMYEHTVGSPTAPLRMLGVSAAKHRISAGNPRPGQVTPTAAYEDHTGLRWC